MANERQRLFVDMDGTLAVFQSVDQLETLYEEGYFLNLAPHENVVEAIRELMQSHPEIEVNILSAVLTDSRYALQEKNAWLDKYLPELDAAHRVFVPCGTDKKEAIPGGVKETDFLLDDYTKNLVDWHPPGRGIKLLNAINHSRGSWQYDRIRYDRDPKLIAESVAHVIQSNAHIYDERPARPRSLDQPEIEPRTTALEDLNFSSFIESQAEVGLNEYPSSQNNEYERQNKEAQFMENQNLIQFQSASMAAIDGYVVMAENDSIYLGKRENYDNAGTYNNTDNSLIAISENPKMFSFLDATEGWILTQQEMIARGIFSEDDYSHYAGLKEILASHYNLPITKDKKFGIDIDVPNSGTYFQYPNWEGKESPDIKGNLFFIDRYYVVQDLQKQGALDIEYYRDIDAAVAAYRGLPSEQMKAFGVDKQHKPNELPGSLDLIQCRDGIDTVVNDYTVVAGWNNAEVRAAIAHITDELESPNPRYHRDSYLVEAAEYARTLSSGSMSTFARQAGVGIDTSNYDALDALQAYVVDYLERNPDTPGDNPSMKVLEACRQYEAERLRELNLNKREVAIESTEDYTDPSFHQNLIDDHIQNEDGSYGKVKNYYRIVTTNEENRIAPFDERVFETYDAAVEAVDADDRLLRVSYDDMVNAVGRAAFSPLSQTPEQGVPLHTRAPWEDLLIALYAGTREEQGRLRDGVYQLLDDVQIGEVPNDLRISAIQENGRVVVSLQGFEEVGMLYEGASSISNEELFAMTRTEFDSFVGQIHALNMVEVELPREMDREPEITVLFKDEVNEIEAGINADGDLYLSGARSGYNLPDTIENRRAIESDIERYTGQQVDLVGDMHELAAEETLEEAVYRLNDNQYLYIQTSFAGYDYTIYGSDMKELDGGQYDDPTLNIGQVKDKILALHEMQPEKIELISLEEYEKIRNEAEWKDSPLDHSENEIGSSLSEDFEQEENNMAQITQEQAVKQLAGRLNDFLYNAETYSYLNDVGFSQEDRDRLAGAIEENLLENDAEYNSILGNHLRDLLVDDSFSDELMREGRDLLYSVEHMDLYLQYAGRETEQNAEMPIQEFRRDGRVLEGSQIPGRNIPANTIGFSDRGAVFDAVDEFEDVNEIPYEDRVIHNGSYEDKEFLYDGYDRYVGMSHQNDLSIQPYMEVLNETASVKEGRSVLPMIAEIYYAQQNGLSERQINFMMDRIADMQWPVNAMKNMRHGFENGLTEEQMSLVMAERPHNTQEEMMEFIADGATPEMVDAMHNADYIHFYILRDSILKGNIQPEVAKAIVNSVENIRTWDAEQYNKGVENGNPDAHYHFSSYWIEGFTEFLRDSAVASPSLTPEKITEIVQNWLASENPTNLITYVRDNDSFGLNPKQEEREENKVAEERVEPIAEDRQAEKPGLSEEAEQKAKETRDRIKQNLADKKDPKETMHEEIANGVKGILNSEEFKNWLDTNKTMFYNNYSFNNAILVWCQRPDATHTMGFEQWKKFGRAVKKGAEGIKIFVPVTAYEKSKDGLWGMIKSELAKEHKANPNNEFAVYRIGLSNIEVTMNQNGLYGLRANGKELGIQTEDQMKDFIKKSVLGKVAMYFSVGTVFDAKDVVVPEHLWMKNGFDKKDMVLDEKGNPVKNRKGEYKIVNTPERQARFNPYMKADIKQIDTGKAAVLYEALKAVSERNRIPVYDRDVAEDDTLKGAAGYYSREFTGEHPKGYIVMRNELNPTEKVSVLLHEMAHSELHGNLKALAERMGEDKIPSTMREIQAEAVAYVVGKDYGIETSTSSFQYLAHYTQGFELQALSKSMEVIYNECKQLTKELKAELESRGLNMDLTSRTNEPMAKETVDTLAKAYAEYAVFQSKQLTDIEKELPTLMAQQESVPKSKENEKAKDLLLQQKENVTQQSECINQMKEQIDALGKAKTLDEQQKCLDNLESAKTRLSNLDKDFNEMSGAFQKLVREGSELKDKFVTNPMNALNEMKKSYPALDELSSVQLNYIAQSEFISRTFTPLLREDPGAFVKNVCDRANQLHDVISKNGVFVEIPFCEQWTDKPIVNGGALMHPKVADAIIKQGEMQTRALKAEAEKHDTYFPYTKCAVNVFQVQKGERGAEPQLKSYRTRIDIGDGGQVSLTDHLKQMRGAKDFVENFEKSTRELGAKEKIVCNEKWKEPQRRTRTAASKENTKESSGKEEQQKNKSKQKERTARSSHSKGDKNKKDKEDR